jgi:hypothetical protein
MKSMAQRALFLQLVNVLSGCISAAFCTVEHFVKVSGSVLYRALLMLMIISSSLHRACLFVLGGVAP